MLAIRRARQDLGHLAGHWRPNAVHAHRDLGAGQHIVAQAAREYRHHAGLRAVGTAQQRRAGRDARARRREHVLDHARIVGLDIQVGHALQTLLFRRDQGVDRLAVLLELGQLRLELGDLRRQLVMPLRQRGHRAVGAGEIHLALGRLAAAERVVEFGAYRLLGVRQDRQLVARGIGVGLADRARPLHGLVAVHHVLLLVYLFPGDRHARFDPPDLGGMLGLRGSLVLLCLLVGCGEAALVAFELGLGGVVALLGVELLAGQFDQQRAVDIGILHAHQRVSGREGCPHRNVLASDNAFDRRGDQVDRTIDHGAFR